MAEVRADPASHKDEGGLRRTPETPRWVKAFGIIALIAVVLVAVLLISGGGNHGPGRHAPSGDAGGKASGSDSKGRGGGGRHEPPESGHTP